MRIFSLLERIGIHVTPNHFYAPVADRRRLAADRELWQRPARLTGIDWDLDAQLAWLEQTCDRHLHEVAGFSFLDDLAERGLEFLYGPIEGQVLHCAIRELAPPRMVEIGSGSSTAIAAAASAANLAEGRRGTEILALDPFASPKLESIDGIEVRRVPAQAIGDEVFGMLADGDLLFIDSTHVLRAGSELPRLYLEAIPSLAPGVIVHIHDIYLPYTFSPWIFEELWDWQESTLLAALLAGNPGLEVLCCQSALFHDRSAELGADPARLRPAAGQQRDPGAGGGRALPGQHLASGGVGASSLRFHAKAEATDNKVVRVRDRKYRRGAAFCRKFRPPVGRKLRANGSSPDPASFTNERPSLGAALREQRPRRR